MLARPLLAPQPASAGDRACRLACVWKRALQRKATRVEVAHAGDSGELGFVKKGKQYRALPRCPACCCTLCSLLQEHTGLKKSRQAARPSKGVFSRTHVADMFGSMHGCFRLLEHTTLAV